MEEGKRFSNEEKDPITSKELNEEPYEMKIFSCMVLQSGSKGDLSSHARFYRVAVRVTYLSTFPLSPPKKLNSALRKVARVSLTSYLKLLLIYLVLTIIYKNIM